MEVTHFKKILSDPSLLEAADTSALKAILEEFPYFQPARALYLKALKNQDSFRYNYELKQTAAYTTDRSVLFDFITSETFEKKETIHQEISSRIESEPLVENTQTQTAIEKVEEDLTIGKPLSFTKSETHSFNEWLQLSVKKPIIRASESEGKFEKKEEKKSIDKFQLIDNFLKSNPKIVPTKKEDTSEIEIPKVKKDKSLMTQTLAKVYLEQKKYGKAIKAYEILSLKYPEKSGFFADQIRKIKILQKNKS